MNELLIRQLAMAIDKRLVVFKGCIANNSILENIVERNTAVFMLTEILRPCCCMVCNINTLETILRSTKVFANNDIVIKQIAKQAYDELARLNGLG